MFDQTLDAVSKYVALIPSVRTTLTTTFDKDIAENTIRTTLENSLGQLVGAFQQFTETLFDRLPTASTIKRRKNAFQNLQEAAALWKNTVGKGRRFSLSC